MSRKLLLLLMLAGCSKGAEADLQYIGDARSVTAEWALLNRQAAASKLNRAYVESMHRWLRQQLETDASALSRPDAPYAAEMRAALQLRDDADAAQLEARARRLKQIEDALESA